MNYLIIPILLTSFLFLNSKSKNNFNLNITEKIPPKVINLGNQVLAYPRIQIKDFGQKAPMIIVIHGRGGTEKFLHSIIPIDLKARIFFFTPDNKERLFFTPRLKDDENVPTPALEEAGKNIEKAINKLVKIYPTNKLIIFGFSQGSALALTYGLTGKANTVMGFSGALPSTLWPKSKNNTKILMWHGNLDTTVPYELGLNTAKAFEDAGFFTKFKDKKNSHITPPKEVVKKYFEIALGDKES